MSEKGKKSLNLKARAKSKSPRRSRSPSPERKPILPPTTTTQSPQPSRIINKKGKFIQSIEKTNGIPKYSSTSKLKITFGGEEMDPSLVNALRRILIGEIKTYSLNGKHTILSNTSNVFKNNEYVLDRIAIIPIYVKDPNKTKFFDDGLKFYLSKASDPNSPLVNENDLDLVVSAYSFQIYDQSGNLSKWKIEDLVSYDYPILKLRKGEEFHYHGEIGIGIGHQNATWKGCRVAYKFEHSNSDISKSAKVSEITGIPLEKNEEKQNYPRNRLDNPENISLTLTGIGHYEPDVCFRLALETLENKLLILQNLVDISSSGSNTTNQKDAKYKVQVIHNTTIENFIQIKIQDLEKGQDFLASHTLGNLLATHMYYRIKDYVKNDLELLRQSMASYRQPHPLDMIVYLDIKTPPNMYKGNTPSLQLFNETVDGLISVIHKLKNEF